MRITEIRILLVMLVTVLVTVFVSCSKDGDTPDTPVPTPGKAVKCELTVRDGTLSASGQVEKDPYAAVTVTSGEDVDYTLRYSIDGEAQARLTGLYLDIARKLDLSSFRSAGKHTIEGYVYHNLDTARFSGTYEMTSPVGPIGEDSTVYDVPAVRVTSVDSIPACGGEVSRCEVTYSQRCVRYAGGVARDTTLTTGGVITYGPAVSAASRGDREGGPLLVDSLSVNVTMNGLTGTASVPVYQAANSRTAVCEAPVVNLSVNDTIPACGGTVSSGQLSYCQYVRYEYTSGASIQDTLTSGGAVQYGNPVSASSLGKQVREASQVGTLSVEVTLNGRTGSASAPVWQQANRPESLTVSGDGCNMIIGDKLTLSSSALYTSGEKETVSATYSSSSQVTINGSVVTARSCGVNGSTVTVNAAYDNINGKAKLNISPLYKDLTYSGPAEVPQQIDTQYIISCRRVCELNSQGTFVNVTSQTQYSFLYGGIIRIDGGYIRGLKNGTETVKFVYKGDLETTVEITVK